MSSIVAEVLQATGKLAKEDMVLKVYDLKRKLEDIKLEVQESLKNRYLDFIPQYLKLDKLITDINSITSEYDGLHKQIESEIKPQMVSSVVEFNDVVEDLKRIKKLKAVALNLSLLHQHLEAAKIFSRQFSYLNAVHSFMEFDNVFQSIDPEDQKDISILSALRIEFIVAKENIIYLLQTIWKERIVITSSLGGRKKSLCLKFNKTALGEEDIEMLIALKLLKELKNLLKEFGKQFLNICETALTKIVKVQKTEEASLTIVIVNDNSPEPSKAFMVLIEVFNFLNEEFFQFPTTEKDEDEVLNSLMYEFGVAVGDEFCTLVVDKCLKLVVPKQSRQMESFREEIQSAENFCKVLMQMGFMSGSSNKLLSFIREVDTLPVNRMALDLLSRARRLLQKKLYQTVTVGDFISASETMDASQLNEMSVNKNTLGKSSFLFPKCQISESVKDLTKLLIIVKEEAKNIDPVHAPRLYIIARNICELYSCVVSTYHKEEIEKIPQQTAIYHNNCMYLAHFMCTFGLSFQSEIQQDEIQRLGMPMTFIDLVPEIRKLGIEAFLAQMRLQKQQLLELLQEQQAYGSLLIDNGAVNKAEKTIRQCLCQLQRLKLVWSEVLPVDVYFKAIGTLFNTCLEEIILRITSMEDIAAEAAARLDCIFDILLKQGPDLFKVPSSDKNNAVHVYVRRWFKFQELQLILSASMREIVDRWASGKGPLATHFSSEEVKRLIRALFQNTERRAAALAKIR